MRREIVRVFAGFCASGAPGNLLVLRSTTTMSPAYLNVYGSGAVTLLDVQDVDATGGDPIVVDAGSMIGAGAAGFEYVMAVPLLFGVASALMYTLLLLSGHRRLARSRV